MLRAMITTSVVIAAILLSACGGGSGKPASPKASLDQFASLLIDNLNSDGGGVTVFTLQSAQVDAAGGGGTIVAECKSGTVRDKPDVPLERGVCTLTLARADATWSLSKVELDKYESNLGDAKPEASKASFEKQLKEDIDRALAASAEKQRQMAAGKLVPMTMKQEVMEFQSDLVVVLNKNPSVRGEYSISGSSGGAMMVQFLPAGGSATNLDDYVYVKVPARFDATAGWTYKAGEISFEKVERLVPPDKRGDTAVIAAAGTKVREDFERALKYMQTH